jgi:quercetin dioxygenase-like cupin family protein
MSDAAATPGQIVEVGPLGRLLHEREQALLVKTGGVEIHQLVIPAGGQVPRHEAQGEIVVHCLEGRIRLDAMAEVHELKGGQLLYLKVNESFSIRAIEDASVLATIILPKQGPGVPLIG